MDTIVIHSPAIMAWSDLPVNLFEVVDINIALTFPELFRKKSSSIVVLSVAVSNALERSSPGRPAFNPALKNHGVFRW